MARKSTTKSAPPRTLTDFIEAFAQYSSSSSYLKCFRGQRDSSWPSVAGIFRPDLKELLDFATEPGQGRKPSAGMVTAFAIPPEREKYFDSDSVSCLANLANMTAEEKNEIYRLRESLKGDISSAGNIKKFNGSDVIKRLHQFIRSEKPYFQPIIDPIDLFKPYYVHPKMSNRRILAQSGAFILYGINPPKKMFFPNPIEETQFIVPQSVKIKIRNSLENIGINESTLFPEIDKAAARIKNQYKKK